MSRRSFEVLLLVLIVLAVAYEAVLLFAPHLTAHRLPIPYAVPIFDTPFALVAFGVAYLSLERQRLRQDFRSVALGATLWFAGLMAVAHILAQPDYPGTPGVNAGVAPYFFFLGFLGGFIGIGLAAWYGDRPLVLTDRKRFMIHGALFVLTVLIVILVVRVQPVLPSLVQKPGRLTPFACWVAGGVEGLAGVWALLGARRRLLAREQDWFAAPLLVGGFIWLTGLTGFFVYPFRYAVSWYVSGLVRPVGTVVVFVGLLREQVWLYREARARQSDLEGLHRAGQALVASLDHRRIVETIVAKALELSGAAAAVLFRLDAERGTVVPTRWAGRMRAEFAASLELPVGAGVGGRAVADARARWTPDLESDTQLALTDSLRQRLLEEGCRAALAVPIALKDGEMFGALSLWYGEPRPFSHTDVELLSAFGTQASVAIENARAFESLLEKARHDNALQEFSGRLLEATDERTVLEEAVRASQEMLHAGCVGLFLFDANAGALRLSAGAGWGPAAIGLVAEGPSDDSLTGYAFLHKESVQVEDVSREPRFSTPAYLATHGVRAGFAVPLGVRDRPLGVLAAYFRAPHRFTEEESRVLWSLAQQTALALGRVRLYVELQANLERLHETQAQLIQADKLRALGTLLSGMAHEVNNPLSTIMLSVQLLQQRADLAEPIRTRLAAVEEEAQRAARIIRDLLVFARQKPTERHRVDLNEAVSGALALQGPDFDLNSIRVATDLGRLPEIWADAHQLQQVFLNLFTNATHAMKTTGGRGMLRVRSYAARTEVCVEVDDEGPGIRPDHLGRVFEPFFTTKASGEGTGLGLSLSLGIVESHGGSMQAENLPAGGARFTVRLPIGQGQDEPAPIAAEDAPARPSASILVVDDEQALREILVESLRTLGHRADGVATGRAGITALERNAYDLVVLDLRLPDISGRDVWEWIVAHQHRLASRVVFITGDTASTDTSAFLREANRPVLTKPLTIDRVRQTVADMLQAGPGARP